MNLNMKNTDKNAGINRKLLEKKEKKKNEDQN